MILKESGEWNGLELTDTEFFWWCNHQLHGLYICLERNDVIVKIYRRTELLFSMIFTPPTHMRRTEEGKSDGTVVSHRYDYTGGEFADVVPHTFMIKESDLVSLSKQTKKKKAAPKKVVEVKKEVKPAEKEEQIFYNDIEVDPKKNPVKLNAQWTETVKREKKAQ